MVPIQSVGLNRRNRRLLLTTLALEYAIAALATSGVHIGVRDAL